MIRPDLEGENVNGKGYLVDENKNIIDKIQGKIVFRKEALTESGDIPKVFTMGILIGNDSMSTRDA